MPCGFPILIFEFLNWALFLAILIVLEEQIFCDSSFCSLPGGGHSTIDPCNTIYAALAFAIAGWVMFTVSFGQAIWLQIQNKATSKATMEGTNAPHNDLGECDN